MPRLRSCSRPGPSGSVMVTMNHLPHCFAPVGVRCAAAPRRATSCLLPTLQVVRMAGRAAGRAGGLPHVAGQPHTSPGFRSWSSSGWGRVASSSRGPAPGGRLRRCAAGVVRVQRRQRSRRGRSRARYDKADARLHSLTVATRCRGAERVECLDASFGGMVARIDGIAQMMARVVPAGHDCGGTAGGRAAHRRASLARPAALAEYLA